jgi:DMSO/TMAO reductase YedYZ molybdopterin-dependent catalytic subunit
MRPIRWNRREWLLRLIAAGCAGSSRGTWRQDPGDTAKVLPLLREFAFSELSSPLTPARQFFLRSHLGYPQLDISRWELTVDGRVKQPLKLNFAQLSQLSSETRRVTFECSGNPPGGGLISTADWRGTRLHAILERAGVLPGAQEIVFEGADFGIDEAENIPLVYSRSIPLEKALADETMVAWEMNGQTLPREHGFPARVIVPGYYAMSHVKWLTRIRVLDRPFRGFYMVKRYFTARRVEATGEFEIRPELKMKLKSQIARPVHGEQIASESTIVTGAAWAGDGLISRVEVSTDGGADWVVAELMDKPQSYSWVRWRHRWTPARNGAHTVVCRAFDDRGGAQPETADPTVINRYGNNWYHRVELTVRRG